MAPRSESDNPETTGLKGRRASGRPPAPAAGTTPLSRDMDGVQPTPADRPFHGALAARHPGVLLDPAAMPVVREGSGYVSEARLGRHYVVAEFDATETFTPPGCVTPITRVLWHAGNQVRKDAYALYVERYGRPGAKPESESDGAA